MGRLVRADVMVVALLARTARQKPHIISNDAALLVRSHILFHPVEPCLSNATDSFSRSSPTCQTPRSVSEKMSNATLYFKGPDVCAGRFFGREEICGFWLKK